MSTSSRPSSQSVPFLGLPDDLLYTIFRELDFLDLVNVRQVSKRFRESSNDSSVWKSVYASARLPRPPGPFSWQSSQTLERILVKSSRVARVWLSHSSTNHLFHSPIHFGSCNSWVIMADKLWASFKYQLICFDICTGSKHVLWDWDRIFHIYVSQSVSADGNWMFVLAVADNAERARRLHQINLNTEPPSLMASWDISAAVVLPASLSSHTSFLVIDSQLFDTRFGTLYDVPRPESSITLQSGLLRVSRRFVLTKTHLVALSVFKDTNVPFGQPRTHYDLFQFFALPDSPSSSDQAIPFLHLTHEKLVPNERPEFRLALLHDSVVDHITLSTKFKLLKWSLEYPPRISFECIDVALRNPSSFEDAPMMSIKSQLLYKSLQDDDFRSHYDLLRLTFVASSDDGHARVLFQASEYVRKFTIDASEDECKVMIGARSKLRSATDSALIYADCLTGRFYFTRAMSSNSNDLVIYNLE